MPSQQIIINYKLVVGELVTIARKPFQLANIVGSGAPEDGGLSRYTQVCGMIIGVPLNLNHMPLKCITTPFPLYHQMLYFRHKLFRTPVFNPVKFVMMHFGVYIEILFSTTVSRHCLQLGVGENLPRIPNAGKRERVVFRIRRNAKKFTVVIKAC